MNDQPNKDGRPEAWPIDDTATTNIVAYIERIFVVEDPDAVTGWVPAYLVRAEAERRARLPITEWERDRFEALLDRAAGLLRGYTGTYIHPLFHRLAQKLLAEIDAEITA